MTTRNNRERAFRQLLVREAGTGAGAPAIAAAVRKLGDHLTQRLAPVIGDGGATAICNRSLHLTESRFSGLTARRSSEQGPGPFARAQVSLEHQESAMAADAAVALFTTVSKLLASFIGESLTTRLLREAWPDDFPAAESPGDPPDD